ncbi:LLM class flavin-dependent oxidoreductase [Acrocarpospora macrocephala]|uniref:Monooxygenase n=1 Tax=Acrocarpospora macrocephala TaxID=150177 RepID=A0A5M3WTD8_9ACTN|nr:NtaA/DmoA family FMN-dependent monooxygenase [Acrocarpospora macrocephala]GES11766.1 monooxygenase [Acrocarpospora macrocephala]
MTAPRKLRFSSLALPPGGHLAAWRHPSAQPDAELNLAAVAAYARRIEEAGFSALFVADDAAVRDEHLDSLSRTTQANSFEPLTLLSALATRTDRIGLVATATTSFNEPFHVARRLASLDHISGGRAGWNVDTSVVPREAGGFVRDEHDVHEERYERAEEFLQIVRELWDSYADDAIVADKRTGLYFTPRGRRPLNHVGKHFRVAGPLNVSRPTQGHPVVFHAAATPTEIAFAGRQADVVLTAARSIDDAHAYRARLDDALVAVGRASGSVQVWPGLSPIVASTEGEATTRRDELRDLLRDATPRPVVPDGTGGLFVVGTPEQVADRIAEWHEAGAADGFTVRFPLIPADADPFLDEVLPILARRGLFAPPEGATLRDFLGLSRPERSVA